MITPISLRSLACVLVTALVALPCWGKSEQENFKPYAREQGITLKEYVDRSWEDELIHYALHFEQGAFPTGELHVVANGNQVLPSQLSDVQLHEDGSLKAARLWLVVTLQKKQTLNLKLIPGARAVQTDLRWKQSGGSLEVNTAKVGARFFLGEKTFETPVPADRAPAYITAVRLRSGVWGGKGWFETPHKLRSYKITLAEKGPVFVKVAFEYRFDGYRGEGQDIYKGHVRIARAQELIEFVEDYSLGDPKVYQIWKPKSRAEEIMWDWWQWRPHDAESNFCFSIYEGLQPTKARWYGHSATAPEKRTGRNPHLDFETDYTLNYSADRFDFSINAYHRGCPDQALSYMAWRDKDPKSDAVGILGLRPTEWQHADMLPRNLKTLAHHTDTADLRIYANKKPDLVVKAPLHLGRRVWGLVALRMPEAGPTQDEVKDGKVVKHASHTPSQALQLRSKYGNRSLDKIKDWCLEWESTRTYPSLFVKRGGLEAVLRRIRSSRILLNHARSKRHLSIMRYFIESNAKHANETYEDLMTWCKSNIELFFEHGYCSHRGLNNNQYPWWMQEMSARFDLVMGMPEISHEQKEALKAYFSFCTHMLQDDDFMPPRTTGVGWGSANMPVNTRGGRAVSAAVLSDNPNAKPWFDRAVEYVDAMVLKVWSEDGSSISGPHYVTTQADPLMNMALPLYYAGVLPPIQKKYPRIGRFARQLMDRLTPPERRCEYKRLLPTIGHTMYEYDGNIGKFAVMMNLTDPKMAGQMYWLWKRAGKDTRGFMDGIYYMHEEFKESEPEIGSVVYPGALTFLRHGFPRENETYMAIHVGDQGYDHFDRDIGSFLIYAKGAPLMMDFASMYQPNCWQSLWHNTLSWNVQEHAPKTPCPGRGHKDCWHTGKIWKDHQYRPHHLLDRAVDSQSQAVDAFKEQAGKIASQALMAEVDYVLADIPLMEFHKSVFFNKAESDDPVPWMLFQEFDIHRLKKKRIWQRRFLFIKDADLNGPNYFVIADDLDGQDELAPVANFWCLADEMAVEKDIVRWTGQYEIDLDMYVAFPKKPVIQRREWWHTNAGPARAKLKNGREHQIAAHVQQQPGKGGFTAVLYPRGRYETQPTYSSNNDGTAIQVKIGNRTDTIFCSRETKRTAFQSVTCEGTVAVVKHHPDYTSLTLSEPGKVTAGAFSLQSKASASIRVTGDKLTGKGKAGAAVLVNGKKQATIGANGEFALSKPGAQVAVVIE